MFQNFVPHYKLFGRLKIYWTIHTSRYCLSYWDVAQSNFLHIWFRQIYPSHITRYFAFDVSAFFRKRSHIWRNETYCKEYGMQCFQRRWIGLIFATIYRPQRYSIGAFMNNFSLLLDNLELLSDKTHCFGRFQRRHYEQPNFSFEFQFWISCQGKGFDSKLKTLRLKTEL